MCRKNGNMRAELPSREGIRLPLAYVDALPSLAEEERTTWRWSRRAMTTFNVCRFSLIFRPDSRRWSFASFLFGPFGTNSPGLDVLGSKARRSQHNRIASSQTLARKREGATTRRTTMNSMSRKGKWTVRACGTVAAGRVSGGAASREPSCFLRVLFCWREATSTRVGCPLRPLGAGRRVES